MCQIRVLTKRHTCAYIYESIRYNHRHERSDFFFTSEYRIETQLCNEMNKRKEFFILIIFIRIFYVIFFSSKNTFQDSIFFLQTNTTINFLFVKNRKLLENFFRSCTLFLPDSYSKHTYAIFSLFLLF